MIVLDRVSKRYDDRGLEVLEDVSLMLERGDSLAIMGPSGSGKSTLLNLMGAIEPPSSGTVTIDGTNPYTVSDRAQAALRGRTIGFVFQDHLLLPQLSAEDNVLAPTLVAGPGGRAADFEQRARSLLEAVGLAGRRSHLPAELSGGERQRVAIARALIRRPALVLCDEPTGNLDAVSARAIADLLLALHAEERTVLVVATHSVDLASRLSKQMELRDRRLQGRV